jgi:hypothetical protein
MPRKFPPLTITLVEQVKGSGDYYVEFDMSDEFTAWFKKEQGLKRWSNKRFEKWVSENIEEIVAQQEQKNEK